MDEDIKIMIPKKREEVYEQKDEYITEKANGNIKKAHKLGEILAQKLIIKDENDSEIFEETDRASYVRQKRILLVFTIINALNILSPNVLVAKTAAAEFDNQIREKAPEIYDDISEGTAFTLYYLSLRKEDDPVSEIGKSFAYLCGFEDNKIFIQLGEEIYKDFFEVAARQINKTEFKK